MILVNFKAYVESMGLRGLAIAKICEKVSQDLGVSIVVAPQPFDLALISEQIKIPIYAQHVDAISPGSKTGWISPEAAKTCGAAGIILNHSEHPMKQEDIKFIIERCKKLELVTCVCAKDVTSIKACASLGPDYVAIEPPELIGGDISVVDADPGIVERAVRTVKQINEKVSVLCGAGIKDSKDISKALSLGTKGVLVASGVVKVTPIEEKLREMAKAFMKT